LSFPCPQEVSTFATDDLAVVGGASRAAGINGQQGKATGNNREIVSIEKEINLIIILTIFKKCFLIFALTLENYDYFYYIYNYLFEYLHNCDI